ncbi:50S ribosomal protein L11 methyltransferase [Quisquiliibacterium transsilvanicum]|uniref:Ribosomal protein L11 methyltransferase n=1 Tax=Quisquiliibacterium transsilvanicum TaxID=1549638 RepID=A0A7W8M838_9BURK|nr:50S ribosomal protein L11 methyltransferase [Quisquiliibacterium transsilvanicum]MBB5271631.1 ribosomal protein L11 methyltransferase [Quisquiliibacterium transsilvanicum]
MSLRELIFLAGADEVDHWSDALLEAGALSVQAEDADADSPDEQAIYGEPGIPAVRAGWDRTRLTVLIAEDDDPAAVLARAATEAGLHAPEAFEVHELADRDWVGASQAQFTPIPVGDRLLITPSWHMDELARQADGNADDRITIVLDPGLAFGTGSHPTTHMCLQWLGEHLRPGERVIDYGCGSGILAIAAARLGAGAVVGVDIDPQAVSSTRANALVNGVEIDVRLSTEAPPVPADVVVANILSNPLKVLAPMLSALVAPGGRLVLAGLLDRQAAEVAAAYPLIDLTVYAEREGWACLAGAKRR